MVVDHTHGELAVCHVHEDAVQCTTGKGSVADTLASVDDIAQQVAFTVLHFAVCCTVFAVAREEAVYMVLSLLGKQHGFTD